MMRVRVSSVLLLAISAAALTGCSQKMDEQSIKDMKPERPAQLDMLNQFVGNWKGTSEGTMCGSDEVCKGTGTSTMAWDLDKNVLVEHSAYDSEMMGNMKGLGTWSWDYRHKRFRITWHDTWGSYGEGYAKVCDDGKCWKMRAKSSSPMGNTIGKGTMTVVDKDTLEFTWKEYCCFGLMKVFEMKGTSKRQ